MKKNILFFFILFVNTVSSQNLILNGSIELLDSPCVNHVTTTIDPIATDIYAYSVTPDVFNECAGMGGNGPYAYMVDIPKNCYGYQWARTGRGMMGFLHSGYHPTDSLYGYEIITFKLAHPLVSGKTYYMRFFVSLSEHVGYGSDMLEAALSVVKRWYPLSPPPPVVYSYISHKGKGIIMDTSNWVAVFGKVTAIGPEKYVNVGALHFYLPDSSMAATNFPYSNFNVQLPYYGAVYYIDDMALWDCDTNIAPKAEAGKDTILCLGDSAYIGGNNYPDYYYSWYHDKICYQNGPTEIQRDEHQGRIWVKPNKSTWYYVRATDFKYDKSIDSIFVAVRKCSLAKNDTTICKGDEVVLGNDDVFFNSWKWWPDDYLDNPSIASPIARPPHSLKYYVQSTDTLGNLHRDSISVKVKLCDLPPEIIIPNVITPNGDGINDDFRFKNEEFWKLKIQIFNRWGEEVFYSNSNQHWDGRYRGREVSEGVYFYHIEAQTEGFDVRLEYSGSLQVFR